MRNRFSRGDPVPDEVLVRAEVARGDRVLAAACAEDGTWLLGTRDGLVVVTAASVRWLPWEGVETAEWDKDESRLRVAEVGEFGQERPVHTFTLPGPGTLLQLVRERVTASVLMQRRAVVSGRQGLTVVARRPPRGQGEITWAYELDPGVDPDDPAVRWTAEQALRAAQDELGAGPEPGGWSI